MWAKVERFFRVESRNTSTAIELQAGTISFLTMAYILLLNPEVMGITGLSRADVVVATAISSAISCFLCGIGAYLPFGCAPGLGLSAYLAHGLVKNGGFSAEEALTACAVSGILGSLIAVFRIGEVIMKVIPNCI